MGDDEQIQLTLIYADAWGAASRALAFRRLMELLVGSQGGCNPELRARALATLDRLRGEVSRGERRAAALLAAERWPDPSMLRLFRNEAPEDIAELVHRARSDDTPQGPASTASGDPAIEDGVRQVRALRDRLHQPQAPHEPAGSALAELAGEWRWESDAGGHLTLIEGPAPDDMDRRLFFDLDPSNLLWEAFRRRAPFRDVAVHGGGTRWRFSGVPFFAHDGRFDGYRGVASAAEGNGGLLSARDSSDALAKVAHEVRSPLNAIMGFAQMIEAQTLGPAPAEHRRQAGHILDHATRLLGALDDLTDAARLDQGLWPIERGAVDAEAVIERVASRYQSVAAQRGAAIAVTCAAGLPRLMADSRSLERALNRLVAAVLAVCAAGETLLLGAQRASDGVRLSLTRPERLADLDESHLMSLSTESNDAEPIDAPLLGLGFGLRLVRQLTEAMGGRLMIEPHHFALTLTAANVHEQAVANEGENA